MNWRLKVAAYHLLSAVPGGAALYRFSQENVTHSLTPTRERLGQKIGIGLYYADWLERNGRINQLLDGTHLDFGSGWHPTIPLLDHSLGVKRQHLFDLVPVLNDKMVARALDVFLSMVKESGWPHHAKLRRLPPAFQGGDWRQYLEQLGISYHAPYMDVFPSLANKVDVVTSTQVLLHIPRDTLLWCFRQIHASLKSGGIFMATIHLRDILAGNLGSRVATYEQLKYSPETWERWINSRMMSFSRLKAPDYRELLETAGFKIEHFEVEPGTEEDARELDRTPIDPYFRRYSREDLLARHLFFAARKQ